MKAKIDSALYRQGSDLKLLKEVPNLDKEERSKR